MENNVSKIRKGSVQATAEVEVMFLNSYFVVNVYKNIIRCDMAHEALMDGRNHDANDNIRDVKTFLEEIAKTLEA